VQHAGFHPAARVEGCYAGVMGFPLCHLARTLNRFKVTMPVDVPAVCQAHTGFACQVFGEILHTGDLLACDDESETWRILALLKEDL
jgi:hypothetical protein